MPSILLSDNGVSSGSAGLKSTAASDGVLILQTTTSGGTATTAVTADNLQNVGFGGVTPNVWQSTRKAIQVGDTSALAYGGNQTTVGNNFFINSSGINSYIKASTYAHIYIQGSDGSHEWYTAPNTGTAGGSASFTRLLAVNTGYSLALQGANSQTGTGITFPAAQSASSDANTLDDYEEGTWTPTLTASGGTLSVTYTSQSGTYTKIGNLVTVRFRMRVNSQSGGSGEYRISGLPFTAQNAGDDHIGVSVLGFEGHPIGTGQQLINIIDDNTTYVRLLHANNNTGWSTYTPASNCAVYGSFSYAV